MASRAEQVKITSPQNTSNKRNETLNKYGDPLGTIPDDVENLVYDVVLGRGPSMMTSTVEDPMKQNVASPLSKYLQGEIGQSVPRYDGRILSDFSEKSKQSAQDFMNINPTKFFAENIESPALNQFQEQLAIDKEDFAGRLSGSDRFRTQEESASRFSRDLAGTKAQFLSQMPQQQFAMALAMKQEDDKEQQAQYQDWIKSLPQYNPVLDKALTFLNEQTSTGTTVLSALDEGSEGILGDLLKIFSSGG